MIRLVDDYGIAGRDSIVMPELPDGYETALDNRRPAKGVDELCLVALHTENDGCDYRWVDSEAVIFDDNPNMGGIIATRKLKQIDMSRMIGQYCEFGHDGGIEKLINVNNEYTHPYTCKSDSYNHCTPIYNHPYAYTGGECPVPEGFDYKVTLADRVEYTREELKNRVHCWKFSDSNDDEQNPARMSALFYVINFTITGILPRWKL